MRRYSTPQLSFPMDEDFKEAQIYLYFVQDDVKVTKSSVSGEVEIETDSISTHLTQQETAKFKVGLVKVQMRYIFADGTTDATTIATIPIADVLDETELVFNAESNVNQ